MTAAIKKFTASDFSGRHMSTEARRVMQKVLEDTYRDQQALLKKAAKIK